jgi:circadian clock protein KaiB
MSRPLRMKFRLYIAGDAPNSVQAVANLQAICREHLPGRHEIEIVDVICDPKKALDDGVLLTPTLVKLAPNPVRKIIGNLSDRTAVLHAFGLQVSTP